jgi:hypothetical protein
MRTKAGLRRAVARAGPLVAGLLVAGPLMAGTLLAAAGCSNVGGQPTGTVTGTFVLVGGASAAPEEPLPGTISFRQQAGTPITLTADRAGQFSGQLPVGTYVVSGTSMRMKNGKFTCPAEAPARVLAGQTAKVTVMCSAA